MNPSLNQVILIGTVTRNFAPRSERGPALLKVKTQRNGYGERSAAGFDDYVPVTCFGRCRERCLSIQEGDVVRVVGNVSERKVGDEWKVQIMADEVMRFGEPAPVADTPAVDEGVYDGEDIPF